MSVFKLPDLGEGLPDAEIVEWFVSEGDQVVADQPMVSMETAKAVVDVPTPQGGTIARLHGKPGDVIETGAPLVTFQADGEAADEAADAEPTPASEASETRSEPAVEAEREDTGTVVGNVETSDALVADSTHAVGRFRVTPAVRALARKLGVDLGGVEPSAKGDVITAADVRAAAESPALARQKTTVPQRQAPAPAARPATGGDWQPVRGTRRSMARAMAQAHAAVVPTTITEDIDVALWEGRQDITARMIRAVCAGAAREPGLNAWFDAEGPKLMIHEAVHVGIAVDTPDGLFVSTLRDAHAQTASELRSNINHLRSNVENRSIPPRDLSGYTIILSNVGIYAGKYTSPVITPPCVAILATGRMREQPVASFGGIAVHPVIPVSLTFDHRAATGGEAARFLGAFVEDLAAPR